MKQLLAGNTEKEPTELKKQQELKIGKTQAGTGDLRIHYL